MYHPIQPPEGSIEWMKEMVKKNEGRELTDQEAHEAAYNYLNFFNMLIYLDKKQHPMKKLYLDIDGVLLTKQGVPATHIVEFLKFATSNFDCYWLTTHCDGDATTAFLYLVGKFPPEAVPYLEKIKPTKWKLWKPEGIDFSSDFFWLDDYAFDGDRKVLEEHKALERLITIDLQSNPNQLLDLVSQWQKQGV